MPNYALDAIRGYNAVDDIFRRDRMEKQAEEDRKLALADRERNIARQNKQDQWATEDRTRNIKRQDRDDGWAVEDRGLAKNDRAGRIAREDRLEEWAVEDRGIAKADRARNIARQGRIDARQDQLWARDDKAYADQQALRVINVAEIESMFGLEVAQNPQAAAKISGMMQDPARVGELIAVGDELSTYLSAGKTPPQNLIVKALNLTGAEELQQRSAKDGLARQVESMVPSPKPNEVMIGFTVTGKDGKTYQAPMTTGASADPEDNIVHSIPVSQVVQHVSGALATAKAIAIAKARAGDNSFVEAYRAANGARQAHAQEMADYEAKKAIDQKYAKPATPAVKGLDDGTFSVYDHGTQRANIVYPPQVAEAMAEEQSLAWQEEQGRGVLNSAPDEAARLMKKAQIKQQLLGGNAGGGGAYPPGATVRQNGKLYVADANGVMQEQGAAAPQATAQAAGGNGAGSAKAAEKPSESPKQGKSAPDRKLELERQKAERKGQVVGDDLKGAGGAIVDTAKALPGAFVDTVKVGLDIYQSLVGQPLIDAISQLKTAQQKQAAMFNIEQRYKNGTLSADDYGKAITVLNGK